MHDRVTQRNVNAPRAMSGRLTLVSAVSLVVAVVTRAGALAQTADLQRANVAWRSPRKLDRQTSGPINRGWALALSATKTVWV